MKKNKQPRRQPPMFPRTLQTMDWAEIGNVNEPQVRIARALERIAAWLEAQKPRKVRK
jgi:hypothetical protein